jgi:polysaccharide pyruvyl transferase WcaK-like protein
LLLEPSDYLYEPQYRIAVVLRSWGPTWSQNRSYIDTVVNVCEELSDDYEVVFVPFQPADLELSIQAAENVSNSTVRDYCSQINVDSVLNEFASCDLVIADRLHGNILSACTHTPFISLEYRPKNNDFISSLDLDQLNMRVDSITFDWLEDTVETALHNENIVDQITKQVEYYRNTIRKFSENVQSDL